MHRMMKFLGTGAIAAAVASAAPAAQAATPLPVVYGHASTVSWSDPDVRPYGTERFIFGAGGHQWITKMSWGHWNATNAGGAGTIHTCTLSGGTITCHRHHVTMLLYQVRTHNGHKYYSKLTLRWPNHVQRLTYARHGGTAVLWG